MIAQVVYLFIGLGALNLRTLVLSACGSNVRLPAVVPGFCPADSARVDSGIGREGYGQLALDLRSAPSTCSPLNWPNLFRTLCSWQVIWCTAGRK